MDNTIGILILIALVVCIVLLAVLLIRQGKAGQGIDKDTFEGFKGEMAGSQGALRQEIADTVRQSVKTLGEMVSDNQKNASSMQSRVLLDIDRSISDKQNISSANLTAQIKNIGESLKAASEEQSRRITQMNGAVSEKQELMASSIAAQIKQLEASVTSAQKAAAEAQNKRLDDMDRAMGAKQELMSGGIQNQMKQLEKRLETMETVSEQKLESMRATMEKQLGAIQQDNNKKLDDIRTTVDEKLQKTLDEKLTGSFKLVSERLEQVYKGLGEMQSIASGVGDLKKVLSNVKTRGILGEIQLGSILSEILTPEQYDTEIATVPNSTERVEFAVKFPASEDGGVIYLPIDSKFPGDTYAALQDAYEKGNPDEIRAAYKNLEAVIKKCAKDIRDKYVCPPNTTSFAIMFLPFEGLYAEVVNHSLVEVLQRDYSVNIAGPSTMAAMLNSLQMGFRTLQIQKRTSEVWEVLSAVKTQFDKFDKAFEQARNRIRMLDSDMDNLVGVRTRAIKRKLNEVESMDASRAEHILELDS